MKKRNRLWTKEEDELLIELYKNGTENLPERLDRTEISIQQRIVFLKNSGAIRQETKHNSAYSEKENEYIIKFHKTKSLKEMSEEMKRTETALKAQIARLKKTGRISPDKQSLLETLKKMMISKRDIIKNRLQGYEKLMIAEKLGITLEELEDEIKRLKREIEEEKKTRENIAI